MKILIAMASTAVERGGPTTAADGLARALNRRGHKVTISAHDDGGRVTALASNSQYAVKMFPLSTSIWEYSWHYHKWLKEAVSEFDFVIINSLFRGHVTLAAYYCLREGTPYAIRPHGCLTQSDLERHGWAKKTYLDLVERKYVDRARFVHATSAAEEIDLRYLGIQNIFTAALGVSPDLFDGPETSGYDRLHALYLGRIAPKKGIDILLRALATKPASDYPITLDIVGADTDGLAKSLMDLSRQLGIADRVRFHGHAGKDERRRFLQSAGFFALPSRDENFGIAVAEALAAACPVIITPHVSHAGLVRSSGVGIVSDRTAVDFSLAITDLLSRSEEDYLRMRRQATETARKCFSWDSLAESLERRML